MVNQADYASRRNSLTLHLIGDEGASATVDIQGETATEIFVIILLAGASAFLIVEFQSVNGFLYVVLGLWWRFRVWPDLKGHELKLEPTIIDLEWVQYVFEVALS